MLFFDLPDVKIDAINSKDPPTTPLCLIDNNSIQENHSTVYQCNTTYYADI